MKLVVTYTTYICNNESKSYILFVKICVLDYYLWVKNFENIMNISVYTLKLYTLLSPISNAAIIYDQDQYILSIFFLLNTRKYYTS